jgi:UTP-glucose-1-phosphate uridylyltransferase
MGISYNILQRVIKKDKSLTNALKIMDSTGFRSLLVIDDNDLFAGVLSIGDIQRAIIKTISLDTEISEILRQNPKVAQESTPLQQIKDEMLRFRMEFMPVIDNLNNIITAYFWDELFVEQKLPPKSKFNLPVVIMAGGVGTRLKPLTNVLPKPLIPIGDITIIEEIFDRFGNYGCNEFFVSVNYKADLIEFYLKNQNLPYLINFFREEKPMGTVGSLSLLKDKINQTFFVNNCDILIEQDYSEILDYHLGNKNAITIVASLRHYPIPYGIIESGDNGELITLIEKPELTFKINSGMYIFEPSLLHEIPPSDYFDITQLIEKLIKRKTK